eukprot:5877839-Prymnesium_polylepis.4
MQRWRMKPAHRAPRSMVRRRGARRHCERVTTRKPLMAAPPNRPATQSARVYGAAGAPRVAGATAAPVERRC